MEEGKLEGIKEGIEQGQEKAKLEVAKRLKKMNMKIEDIAKATGLSKSRIEEL